ncbi:MAG: ABC transporter permease [Planctomycetaceae bacterium]|nr:ABC transporter permease [Planctomycetaceae bacterium]
MNLIRLVFDNLIRNPLRTVFTSLATMVMVLVVTAVFSILSFLAKATTEKAENLKGIVTERWQIPSQMPWAYAAALSEGAPHRDGDIRVEPKDSMTWSFYGGATVEDPAQRSIDTILFAFCLQPQALLNMMDDLDTLQGEPRKEFEKTVARLEENRIGIILGKERARLLGKNIGDRLKVYSFNYKGLDLEFEVVGFFPEGRYDPSAAMRADYLQAALDGWPREHNGAAHPMAGKSLNLVWLRLQDQQKFAQVSEQILTNSAFTSPSVKFETASSGISTFLQAYADLIWGMQWLLAPAILFTLSTVISNSISINVRVRRTEFAVLKVLGFRPWQILTLVLLEALLVGTLSGVISSGGTFLLVNNVLGGLKFPIAFFGSFFIPVDAWWWGAAIGSGTAFVGSVLPAWSARTVKVAEVFSRLA